MARLVVNGEFVGPGERATAAYLEANLPNPWVVVCNKVIPSAQSSREIDFVVVGIYTIFAIEEKHWSGVLRGNEQRWWPADGGPTMGSPLNQIHQAQQRLRSFLEREIDGLSDVVGPHAFIQQRVILSHPQIRTQIEDPRASERLIRLDGCEEDLISADDRRAGANSIAPVRDALVQRLEAMPDREAIPSVVGDYEVLEVLGRSHRVLSLHARHVSGSERVLKLVEKPVTALASHATAFETATMREWDALQILSGSGVAPQMDPFFSWSDGDFWVFPIHLLPGLSLRADVVSNGVPTTAQAIRTSEAAFEALAKVHEQDVVHRSLTPDSVHVLASGSVAFSGFQIARLEGSESVFEFADQIEEPNAYRAPECMADVSLASRASDVYSLAASLWSWIVGDEIGEGTGSIIESRPDLEVPAAEVLSGVISSCMDPQRDARPSATVAARELGSGEAASRTTIPVPGEFEVGELIEQRFEVIRPLGSGATAVTYLVEDQVIGSRFVIKALRNPRLAPLVVNEFRMLADVAHPSLVRVFEVYPSEDQFLLKLEYVEGLSLRDLAGRYIWNAEAVVGVGAQIADVLAYLVSRDPNLTHRDVSPANILVPEDSALPAKLIDFGFATLESEAKSAVGTPLYRAPEADGGAWSPACDVYSLAAVLATLLTGRPPFDLEDGVPIKDRVSTASDYVGAPPSCVGLLSVLLKQLAPDPADRYQSAPAFRTALEEALTIDVRIAPTGERLANSTVDDVRRLFRNTRLGNADNRGLDTPFARETYVPTALDENLLPSVLDGTFRLVILSGNPGDGKTAFLQRIMGSLEEEGGSILSQDEAGWRVQLGDRTFAAVFDASESHGDLSADDLIHDLLEPMSAEGEASSYTALLAANDGRLITFFDKNGRDRYPGIWGELQPQLLQGAPSSGDVLLIDLKRRALSDGTPNSLFDRLLNELVAPERWSVCQGCEARFECPILMNAKSLSHTDGIGTIRARFRDMLLAIHLRREQRPTVRDLRSAFAFVLTHDLGCEDIHAERDEDLIPSAQLDRLYHNSAFSGGGSPDLVLDEWARLDPADHSRPALDRFLYFNRRPSQLHQLSKAFADVEGRLPMPGLSTVTDGAEWLRGVRRRYFFEGSPIEPRAGGDPLPDPTTLLPYRHLEEFLTALIEPSDTALSALLRGISVADGVPLAALSDGLRLSTGDPRSEVAVIKSYNTELFELLQAAPQQRYVESLSDSLILRRKKGFPTLQIDLDLFEFLLRSADGQLPGALEQRALVEDITAFRNQLLAEPSQEVLILEAGRRLHQVNVEAAELILGGQG
jgi:serine/threonine protein kinase